MNRISVENPDDDDDRIYLTRPVIVLSLAQILGVKPHVMLAEMMMRKMFFNLRDTVSDEVAKEIARRYHRVLVIRDEKPKV